MLGVHVENQATDFAMDRTREPALDRKCSMWQSQVLVIFVHVANRKMGPIATDHIGLNLKELIGPFLFLVNNHVKPLKSYNYE